ncbi:uncharacterized protein LOC143828724 isoform X2 [Paroedura picta]|uniref:uncharacterized protein LOC143828724 isoform X2 n=1 Tax=Paroedura picta TaxID=143630 RepID=UPI0040565E8B
MWSTLTRILMLLLHTAQSEEDTETLQKLHLIVASPGDTVRLSCSPPPRYDEWAVTWYKEQRDRSLHRISQSYRKEKLQGKDSGWGLQHSISRVQRNDSGVYYCLSEPSFNPRFINGTRLIVADASRPSHSILVPFPLEGPQPDRSVPRLCLTFDADPKWENVSWDAREGSSRDWKGVGVLDEDGAFSVWHLEMVPWTEKASSCALQESGSTSSETPTSPGTCLYSVYIGIPCIFLLLVLSLALLFWKHQARGVPEQDANQIPRRETPQTDYAEVSYENRDALCED